MLGTRDSDLRDADVHALIRLAGEIAEMGTDVRARRQHCLLSLAALCNADKGIIAEFKLQTDSGRWQALQSSVQFLNTPEHERRLLLRFYGENEPIDPVIDHMGRIPADVLVGRPGDFLNEGVWRASAHYNLVRRPAGVLEQIYGRYRFAGLSCGIGLHRRNQVPFQRREISILTTFMHAAGRMLHVPAGSPPVLDVESIGESTALPPRLAAVLARFMRGETEKEAARQLGITHHTVHSYAKQIYRQMGVKSRSELLARFIRGPSGLNSD